MENGVIPPTAHADWRWGRTDYDLDLLVVERNPQLEPDAKVASWWRHFQPLQAQRLAGSRWHVISEAARQGRVLMVRPS